MTNIIFKKEQNTDEEIYNILHPFVKQWFQNKFSTFALPQKYAVLDIHSRLNVLISAATGSGKTLTAFLSILNELVDSADKGILEDKIYCVYISPLKALNNDIEKNLLEPLNEIEEIAQKKLGIRVAVRTGDTTAKEKSDMLKKPPHILITTPESLAIVLSSEKFIEHLKKVDWCVIDEVHALAENKRGVHLSLSLERLQHLAGYMCRIGLSACLHYNEYVALANGQIIKIGKLVENYFLRNKVREYKNLEYVNVKNLNVFSFNEGRIVKSKVSKLWRIPSPDKIAELTLETNKKIKITLNDELLTFQDNKFAWIRVDHLKEEDFICTPKKINVNCKKIELLNFISNSKDIFTMNPHKLIKKQTDRYCKKNRILLKKLTLSLKISYKLLMSIRKGHTKTISLYNLNNIIKIVGGFSYYPKKFCGKTGKHFIKLPKHINKDFMYLLGLLASDGHIDRGIVSFFNKDNYLLNNVKKLFKNLFGRLPSERIHSKRKKNNIILTFKSLPLSIIFNNLGLNFGNKIRTMTINNKLFFCSDKEISSFISGYIDGDGAVSVKRKRGGYLRLHSSSKKFIFKLYYLFVRLGIHPYIRKRIRSKKSQSQQSCEAFFTPKNGHSTTAAKQRGINPFVGNKQQIRYYLEIICARDRLKLSKILSGKKSKKLLYNIENEQRSSFYPIGKIIKDFKNRNKLSFKQLDKFLGAYSHDIITRGYCSEQILEKIIKRNSDRNLSLVLKNLIAYNVNFERIKMINIIKNNLPYVYDLSVKNTNNFIASNIIVHNTVAPLESIAQFLVGNERQCTIIDAQHIKNYDLKVVSPVPNLIDTEHNLLHQKMYGLIDDLIQQHRTTLIFTNTRSATERVVDHLKNKFPKKYSGNIGAHHGSLGKEMRHSIEQQLREGKLKVVVSSTSLELGIDIGYIDLVICLGSPKSVARTLQRLGRSGHKLHETTKGRIIVMDRDDLVECAVMLKNAVEKNIDKIHIPENCLDVLAQQIFGMALQQVWDEKELYQTIQKSYCYRNLSKQDFNEVLSYLAGEYVDLEERHIYARIWRKEGKIGKRGRLARVLYMTNIGTIPDESFITVKIGEQIIGKLDEAFLEKLKPGDVFVLGGDTYMFKFSRGMVAQVQASSNRPPTVPSWISEMLPLSFDLAMEIGKFRRFMLEKLALKKSKEEIIKFINEYLYLDENASSAIYNYFKEQYEYAKRIPNDKTILVEYYNDDREKKIVFHALYGRRVNDCLSRAIAFIISRKTKRDVEIGINDNGFYISGDNKLDIKQVISLLNSEKLSLLMNHAIEASEVYKRRFRHCATRALMILRNYMGRTKNVGRQQVSSMILMNALKRINPEFSILKEAKRECLNDLMDIENTKKIIQEIEKGSIKIEEIHTTLPTPFSFNLALQGYLDILKIEDKHEFLHRMHQMVLAKIGLKTKEEIKDFSYQELWK